MRADTLMEMLFTMFNTVTSVIIPRKAYTQATKEALEACTTKLMQQLLPVLIRTNYTDMGKIQYILNTRQVAIINTEFAEDVVFTVHIPVGDAKAILKEITDATNARAQIEEQDEIFG